MEDNKEIQLFKSLITFKRTIERVSEFGRLSQGEFLVLRRINIEQEIDSENEIKQFKALKISENLLMPPPQLSRILNSLEDKGFIKRNINLSNRRSVLIELTNKGKEALSDANRRIIKFSRGLINTLKEEDTDKLISLLYDVCDYCNRFEGD